jgi:hypothetical protein
MRLLVLSKFLRFFCSHVGTFCEPTLRSPLFLARLRGAEVAGGSRTPSTRRSYSSWFWCCSSVTVGPEGLIAGSPSGLRKMSRTRCRTRASADEMPPPFEPVILLSAFLPILITSVAAEKVPDPAVPVSA